MRYKPKFGQTERIVPCVSGEFLVIYGTLGDLDLYMYVCLI